MEQKKRCWKREKPTKANMLWCKVMAEKESWSCWNQVKEHVWSINRRDFENKKKELQRKSVRCVDICGQVFCSILMREGHGVGCEKNFVGRRIDGQPWLKEMRVSSGGSRTRRNS